jgi:hypothetical protein
MLAVALAAGVHVVDVAQVSLVLRTVKVTAANASKQ